MHWRFCPYSPVSTMHWRFASKRGSRRARFRLRRRRHVASRWQAAYIFHASRNRRAAAWNNPVRWLHRSHRRRHIFQAVARVHFQSAQPAHAADRLPRRGLKGLALAACRRGEYTCRQSRPANDVAVRLSPVACCVVGRNTPVADARAVGRRTLPALAA